MALGLVVTSPFGGSSSPGSLAPTAAVEKKASVKSPKVEFKAPSFGGIGAPKTDAAPKAKKEKAVTYNRHHHPEGRGVQDGWSDLKYMGTKGPTIDFYHHKTDTSR